VTGIAVAILVVIFGSQRYGTTAISSLFAPVVIIWLALNGGIGIRNLSVYGGSIFKAINPAEVVWFFQRNGEQGWRMLGGVVLCITGAEAMYADMGHFTRQSISVSKWLKGRQKAVLGECVVARMGMMVTAKLCRRKILSDESIEQWFWM
jgi:KUP system potassium uptake protein